MKKCLGCITFQGINIYLFLALIFVVLFYIISESFFGFNYNNMFSEINLNKFFFKESDYRHHRLIESCFNYIGTFLFGLACFLFEKFVLGKKRGTEAKSKLAKSLIFNGGELPDINACDYLYLLLISVLWVMDEILITISGDYLKDLDFWFSELIFLSLFLKKYFHIKIYRHQLFAMSFLNAIGGPLKIFTIIFSFLKISDPNKLYVKEEILIPFGIILYFLLYIARAFTIFNIKRFLEVKYISHTYLLTVYGFIGFLLSGVFCLITTFISCNKMLKISFDEDIIKEICFFHPEKNENEYFFDSFSIYFNNFNYFKLILIFLEVVFFFAYKYSCVYMIKYYNPVYLIFSFPIIFFFEKIILIIKTLIDSHTFFDETKENLNSKKLTFSLDIIGDIFSFFWFLIYLEIIVFHCSGLDYNLNRSIMDRSIEDYKNIDKVNDSQYGPIIDDNDEE